MKIILPILSFVFISLSIYADKEIMDIGVFRNVKTSHILFNYLDDSYSFHSESGAFFTLEKGESVRIQNKNGKIRIKQGEVEIGTFKKVYIKRNHEDGAFKIKCLSPSSIERKYQGNLKILAEGKYLKIINQVPLDKYLIGVIESESGNNESKEYYKVQAVISRTYALKHKSKFIHEGFMLTDLTNCQVYKGKMYKNQKIIDAVKETENFVLVDSDMNYITASYYSNSGGQTVNSEDVWSKPLSYLRSVKDPYSYGKTNSHWTKTISKDKWVSYLDKQHNYPIENKDDIEKALTFKQDTRRKYYVDWKYHILLTDIRKDWELKSTYFDVEVKGKEVVLSGKGFGHGVGLSQEGAMNMCDLGYGFLDVLLFYYTQAHLIDLEMMDFYLSY